MRRYTTRTTRNYTTGRTWHTPMTLLLAGASILGLALAISRTNISASGKLLEVLTGEDVSASNASRLDSEQALLEGAVDDELPTGTRMTIWSFSNCEPAHKVYSAAPDSGMALWETEKYLSTLVRPEDRGTHPGTVVTTIADAADASTADCLVVFMLWDGEISGDIKDFSRQVQRLANNQKVAAVVCIGLVPDKGIRSRAEGAMRCLGDRLLVCGPQDRSEISRLSDLLKQHAQRAIDGKH